MHHKYIKKFSFIKSLITKDDPCIVEIGAHYGEDTLRFIETFPSCTLHCFEPDPRNVKVFKKYVDKENVFFYPIALSNKCGKSTFYQSCDTYESVSSVPEKYNFITKSDYIENNLSGSGASSLKKGFNKILNTCEVDTDRYDNWSNAHNVSCVDFCWIDVQGAEKEVILGMGEKIENIKYIFMEYGEKEYQGSLSLEESIDFLSSKDFKKLEIMKNDILFENNSLKKHLNSYL
tara:strand:- start:1120 stop:1818 length:699 start_codon:yes stop_codon:yes gene_type:complete